MSRKLQEIRTDLNSHIADAINSAIEEKVLPSFQNVMKAQNVDSKTKVGLRSDGPQQNSIVENSRKTHVGFPKPNSVKTNQNKHLRESSIDSQESDDVYDRVFHH